MKSENAAGEWDAQISEKRELLISLAFQPKPNNVLGSLSAGRRVYFVVPGKLMWLRGGEQPGLPGPVLGVSSTKLSLPIGLEQLGHSGI